MREEYSSSSVLHSVQSRRRKQEPLRQDLEILWNPRVNTEVRGKERELECQEQEENA